MSASAESYAGTIASRLAGQPDRIAEYASWLRRQLDRGRSIDADWRPADAAFVRVVDQLGEAPRGTRCEVDFVPVEMRDGQFIFGFRIVYVCDPRLPAQRAYGRSLREIEPALTSLCVYPEVPERDYFAIDDPGTTLT